MLDGVVVDVVVLVVARGLAPCDAPGAAPDAALWLRLAAPAAASKTPNIKVSTAVERIFIAFQLFVLSNSNLAPFDAF